MVDDIIGAMLAGSNSPTSAPAAPSPDGEGGESNQRQLYQLGRQLGAMLSQSGQLTERHPPSHPAPEALSPFESGAGEGRGGMGEREEGRAEELADKLECAPHVAAGESEPARDGSIPLRPAPLSSAQLDMSDVVYDGIFGEVRPHPLSLMPLP